jgi:predicted KAP-like P-loop ATPase
MYNITSDQEHVEAGEQCQALDSAAIRATTMKQVVRVMNQQMITSMTKLENNNAAGDVRCQLTGF